MKNSMVYNWYKKAQNIYRNSITVIKFDHFLSVLLRIFVTSKIFALFLGKENESIFEKSRIYKIFTKIMDYLRSIMGENGRMGRAMENSYFINLFTGVLAKRDKDAINSLYLVLTCSLILNIFIKIITGTFILAGNKWLILLSMILIFLYFLQLDYGMMLKRSKVVKWAYEIFYDKPFENES